MMQEARASVSNGISGGFPPESGSAAPGGALPVAELRQQILILYSNTPDLNSGVCAWAEYDGAGQAHHTTGDSDKPPYESVMNAMRDGWRVIQFPQQLPAYPGMELSTSYLRFEHILEKLVAVDAVTSAHG